MPDCDQNPRNASIVVRARERKNVWGRRQVLECRDCGTRWTE